MSQFKFVDDEANNQIQPPAPPTPPVAPPTDAPVAPEAAPNPAAATPTAPVAPRQNAPVPTPTAPVAPRPNAAPPQSPPRSAAPQPAGQRGSQSARANQQANATAPVAPAPPVPPRAAPGARPAATVGAAPPQVAAATPNVAVTHPPQTAVPSTKSNDVTFRDGISWRDQLSKLDPFAQWLFRISAIIGGISLLYLLVAIMGGAGAVPATTAATAEDAAATAAKALQIAHDMGVAARIFQFALIGLSLSALILMLDIRWVGATIAGLGVLLHFGAPLALKAIGQTPATLVTAQVLRTTGFVLLIVGLLKCVIDLYGWLLGLPERMKQKATVGDPRKADAAQQRIARSATMFSPCWKLPFCREVIRVQCPAYLARKRCWKFGRGCYCDQEMVSRIIRGATLPEIKAPTAMSQRANKPPCGQCHIFLEHQSLKYKIMSPLAIPLSGLFIFLIWPFYSKAFASLNKSLDSVWSRFSFDPTASGPKAFETSAEVREATGKMGEMSAEQVGAWAQNIFGVILGFFVLIYVSKLVEWLIYKAKL